MRKPASHARRKKIVLIGGMGTIGKILQKAFEDTYDLLVLDILKSSDRMNINYVQADISDISQIIEAIPDDAHALVILSGLPYQSPIPDAGGIRRLSSVYIVGAYNVLLAASMKSIARVVFASTNHVTGAYETDGVSSLGREIRTDDYPLPDSAYGAMKLCAELFGYLFFREKNMSVISLRLGGVQEDELSLLRSDARAKRTIMSKRDTVEIFRRAIETKVRYGVYYAVSDNPGKPWDLSKTISDLGFRPRENSQQLFERENKKVGT